MDHVRSLLYIKGNVPGPAGGLIKLRDAVKKCDRQVWDLSYPTNLVAPSEPVETWDGGKEDPNEIFYHENDVVESARKGGDD